MEDGRVLYERTSFNVVEVVSKKIYQSSKLVHKEKRLKSPAKQNNYTHVEIIV
jgi:hypothetical protein